jgi:hypothetical protein
MNRELLTDRQLDVYDRVLRRGDQERPTWERGFGTELRQRVGGRLHELSKTLPSGTSISLAKYSIDGVLGCEKRYDASQGMFEWDVARVRGSIVHRAMEKKILGNEVPPLVLTKLAIADLSRDPEDLYTPAAFLVAMSDADRQDLIRSVNDTLVKVESDFPPIPASWDPRCESPITIRFGAFRIKATPDLCLGRPRGTEARAVLIDFKSGDVYPEHVQAIGFYALAETLRTGTPPFVVANYYVDSGEASTWVVDEALLASAERRLLDAARRLAELALGREPTVVPGRGCRWCTLLPECAPGREHLAE